MTRPARRRGLSDRQVAALRKKAKRYTVADPELKGHYVRVMPTGPNIFVAVARIPTTSRYGPRSAAPTS